ncbi:hypothetical protein FOZ63_006579, partial [Perkinsus olseni]
RSQERFEHLMRMIDETNNDILILCETHCRLPEHVGEKKEHGAFAASLSSVLNEVPERDLLILMGDFNCTGYNWKLLFNLTEAFDLCIPQLRKFQHLKEVPTWHPPGSPSGHGNIIDLVTVRKRQINMIEKMFIEKPQYVNTDHKMVIAKFGLHICRKYMGDQSGKRGTTKMFSDLSKPELLSSLEKNMMTHLDQVRDVIETGDLDTIWQLFKDALQ